MEKIHKQRPKKGWYVVENKDNCNGYNYIRINGKMIYRHRLIAYCFLGLDDIVGKKNLDNSIDHIDENKLNNSVSNLRIATNGENQQNQRNAKGYYKRGNKYYALIQINKKQIYLGLFDTKEEARNAYLKAKEKYHPFGSNI